MDSLLFVALEGIVIVIVLFGLLFAGLLCSIQAITTIPPARTFAGESGELEAARAAHFEGVTMSSILFADGSEDRSGDPDEAKAQVETSLSYVTFRQEIAAHVAATGIQFGAVERLGLFRAALNAEAELAQLRQLVAVGSQAVQG